MRRLLLLACCVFVACGPSPTQRCLDATKVTCAKIYECVPESSRQSSGFELQFGKDVNGCLARQASYSDCWGKEKDDDLCVGSEAGKKFDAASADACLSKLKVLTCTDFTAASQPSECASVCK